MIVLRYKLKKTLKNIKKVSNHILLFLKLYKSPFNAKKLYLYRYYSYTKF